MRKVLFLGALLGLFSTSSVIASESEIVNVPVEITSATNVYEDNVNYWVTNVHMESDYGGPYLCFTVHWEYTGSRPNPHIAFMVHIYVDTSLRDSFLDSAIGTSAGSRDYKIKVTSNANYQIVVDGSDGKP